MTTRHRRSVAALRLAGLGVAMLLSGCASKKEEAQNPVVTVDVAPVLNAAIQLTVRADALLYPVQQAAIVPKISAPVKKVYVERGAHVHRGQLLLELENQDLVGALKENQAAYDLAEATYETTARATVPEEVQKAELDAQSAKQALDADQAVFDSRQNLLKEGAVAQKDVNDAQVTLAQARSQYEIARKHLADLQGFATDQSLKAAIAQRDQAKARLDQAEAQLGYSRITSPVDGVVTDRPVYPGETAPSGSAVITVMDLSRVIARAHIAPSAAAALKIGDDATLIGPGGMPVTGKVTVVSPALDPSNTTVEVSVEAANPDGMLKPGTNVGLQIVAKTVSNALVIPETAVLTSASGSTSAIVVDAENKPHKTSIAVGIRDSGKAQVTDGLDSGQRVVTTGSFELAKLDPDVLDKTKVQIQPPKEEEDDDDK